MALTASTLVQETARADRAGLSAGRAGASAGPADAFAQMLQSRVAPNGAEATGPGPSAGGPEPSPVRAPAASAAQARPRVDAPLAAPSDEPVDAPAAEPAGETAAEAPRAGRPTSRAAARPAQGAASCTDAAAGDASAREVGTAEASATQAAVPGGADSLAQWLMQIGVIPALAVAPPPLRGSVGVASGGSEPGAAEDPLQAVLSGGRSTVFRLPGEEAQVLSVGRAAAEAVDLQGQPAQAQARDARLGAQAGLGLPVDAAAAQAAAALPAERFGELLLEQVGGLALPEAAPSLEAAGLAAWSAAPVAAQTLPAAPPAPVEATLQQPFDDPEARAELLLQVGRFVREGVGEARLHLNPAEMGPIQIHIAMDGNAARIDFVAAQAATRELLQSSLAALAESLGADGLTLVDSQVHAEAPRGAAGDSGGAQASASGGSGAGFGRGEAGEGRGRPGSMPVSGTAAGRAGAAQAAASASPSARPVAAPGARALDLYA